MPLLTHLFEHKRADDLILAFDILVVHHFTLLILGPNLHPFAHTHKSFMWREACAVCGVRWVVARAVAAAASSGSGGKQLQLRCYRGDTLLQRAAKNERNVKGSHCFDAVRRLALPGSVIRVSIHGDGDQLATF